MRDEAGLAAALDEPPAAGRAGVRDGGAADPAALRASIGHARGAFAPAWRRAIAAGLPLLEIVPASLPPQHDARDRALQAPAAGLCTTLVAWQTVRACDERDAAVAAWRRAVPPAGPDAHVPALDGAPILRELSRLPSVRVVTTTGEPSSDERRYDGTASSLALSAPGLLDPDSPQEHAIVTTAGVGVLVDAELRPVSFRDLLLDLGVAMDGIRDTGSRLEGTVLESALATTWFALLDRACRRRNLSGPELLQAAAVLTVAWRSIGVLRGDEVVRRVDPGLVTQAAA